MAKVALLPKEKQDPNNPVSSFQFQTLTFVAGEPAQEVNAGVAVMYMVDLNMSVEFTESDFKDLPDKYLERMAERLNVEVKDVKTKVLPRKSVATKVKSTLIKSKVVEEKPIIEEPAEETSSDE